jgi:hypothetical protein
MLSAETAIRTMHFPNNRFLISGGGDRKIRCAISDCSHACLFFVGALLNILISISFPCYRLWDLLGVGDGKAKSCTLVGSEFGNDR